MPPVRPAHLTTQTFNMEKKAVEKLFNQWDPEKNMKPLATGRIKIGTRPAQLLLVGQVAYKGIRISAPNEDTVKHDLTLDMEDEADLVAFETLTERIGRIIPEDQRSQWTAAHSYLYDDKLSVKLRVTNEETGYDFKCNAKLSAKEPSVNAGILYNGREVKIITDLSAWFNFKTKTYGLFFPVKELKVLGEGSTLAPKRKKKEDDEDIEIPVSGPVTMKKAKKDGGEEEEE